MKMILLLAGLAGAALIVGCGTAPVTEAQLDSYVVCDAEFVAKVENEARRHGTAIRWMRCPQLSPAREPAPFHFGDRRDV